MLLLTEYHETYSCYKCVSGQIAVYNIHVTPLTQENEYELSNCH